MKFPSGKKGFTVVELMVAMLSFAVLSVTVGAMMVYMWGGWRDFNESVNVQRDAMLAMRKLSKEIRNSNIDEIHDIGDGIRFDAGVVRTNSFIFYATDIPTSPGVLLFTNSWNAAINTAGVTNVQVSFRLRTLRSADENEYSMTIYPRN